MSLYFRGLHELEHQLQRQVVELTFHGQDSVTGGRVRRALPEVAARMDLPEDRAERLLRAALKNVPMVADTNPIQVLYEDDHILAGEAELPGPNPGEGEYH